MNTTTVVLGTDGLYRQAVEVAVLTVYGRLVIPAVVWPVQPRELCRTTEGEAGLVTHLKAMIGDGFDLEGAHLEACTECRNLGETAQKACMDCGGEGVVLVLRGHIREITFTVEVRP